MRKRIKPKKMKDTVTFFVAFKSSTNEYVSGVQKTPRQILYSTDINDAIWADEQSKVDDYIDHNNIEDVASEERTGGNHPSKPGLP